MKRAIVLATALAAVAVVRDARAGCPGGGGGGGGGASGGGGHDGAALVLDPDIVPPRHGDAACVDDSDIVGYRHCRRFGAWGVNLDLPPLIIEGGAVVRRFGSLLDGQTGTVDHGTAAFAYRATAVTQHRALDTAVLSTVRLSLVLPHHIYTALEVDVGGLAQPGAATTEMMTTSPLGTPVLTQDGGFLVDTLAAVGVRTTFGIGAVGAELAGGLRTVSYSFDSQYLSCATTSSVLAYAAVAEARLRGELWLGPWIAAGVTVGTSVLEQHSWMGGVYLGIHTRAFNGER